MKKLLLTIALVASAAAVYGQGTVQFVNGTFTRFQLHRDATGLRSNVPPSTQLNFGLFWGVDAAAVANAIDPVTPLGSMSTVPGIMTALNGGAYQIPTTDRKSVV